MSCLCLALCVGMWVTSLGVGVSSERTTTQIRRVSVYLCGSASVCVFVRRVSICVVVRSDALPHKYTDTRRVYLCGSAFAIHRHSTTRTRNIGSRFCLGTMPREREREIERTQGDRRSLTHTHVGTSRSTQIDTSRHFLAREPSQKVLRRLESG